MAFDDGLDKRAPVGSVCVDLTATRANGSSVRVLLVDTLADGVTPTARERAGAARIRAARPHDELRLVPKAQERIARPGRQIHLEPMYRLGLGTLETGFELKTAAEVTFSSPRLIEKDSRSKGTPAPTPRRPELAYDMLVPSRRSTGRGSPI